MSEVGLIRLESTNMYVRIRGGEEWRGQSIAGRTSREGGWGGVLQSSESTAKVVWTARDVEEIGGGCRSGEYWDPGSQLVGVVADQERSLPEWPSSIRQCVGRIEGFDPQIKGDGIEAPGLIWRDIEAVALVAFRRKDEDEETSAAADIDEASWRLRRGVDRLP